MEPIKLWCDLIDSMIPEEELLIRLKDIYRKNPPFIAEIIMNSHCPSKCRHCIYAADFERYNRNMTMAEWKAAFRVIHDELGFKRFIFDGRSFTEECIRAIKFLKNFEDVKVGVIADGISIEPFIEELMDFPPDWLDVSVDGLEKDHDVQRNREGAYRKTVNILLELKDSGHFDKINILTCLSTLNIGSILEMIAFLNGEGFKNFFITPVSVLKGYRPDPNLQPQKEDFVNFLNELLSAASGFSDTWLEVDIYDSLYASAIKQFSPEIFSAFIPENEHLELVKRYGNNEVHICYYPSSLTGVREFIVNSNGDIIPPKAMAMGKIPREFIMGNILNLYNGRNIFNQLFSEKSSIMFTKEFMEEKQLLKPLTPFCNTKPCVMAN